MRRRKKGERDMNLKDRFAGDFGQILDREWASRDLRVVGISFGCSLRCMWTHDVPQTAVVGARWTCSDG